MSLPNGGDRLWAKGRRGEGIWFNINLNQETLYLHIYFPSVLV